MHTFRVFSISSWTISVINRKLNFEIKKNYTTLNERQPRFLFWPNEQHTLHAALAGISIGLQRQHDIDQLNIVL